MLIKNKNIHIVTLGCKVNAFESNAISQQLCECGAKIVDEIQDANVCIINTCCVTSKAESKSRYFINRAIRSVKCKLIVIIGCSSQLSKDLFTHAKIGIILGTKYKSTLVNILKEYKDGERIVRIDVLKPQDSFETFHSEVFCENTRAYLKIQDGCDYFCSYCIIPLVRGRQRCLPHVRVLNAISELVKEGYKEIILTGVNTAGYCETNGYGFNELLNDINKVPGKFRIRISSVEPFQINKETIDLITAYPQRWCQHLHICLQNADNNILKDMKRKYSVEEYMDLCQYIWKLNPFFSITTDYIAGFATETEELFLNSVNNLEKLPLAHMHIFPYSSRPFTAASHLRNLVNDSVKKQRINILEKVNEKLNVQYLRRFIGKTVNVLFEKTDDLNLQHGHSEYHFMVFVKTTKRLSSELLSVKISEFKNNQLFGILV